MAEGLFRYATQGRTDCRVISAGVGAMEGQPPSPHAVRALKDLGIDISHQRSRMLTADLVEQADYIFGMTHSHVDSVNLLFPQAAEKTFLLREFDETLDEFEKDISDPIGGPFETYAYCRDQIEQGIFSMLGFMDKPSGAGFPSTSNRSRIALGCDHAGFHLKEALKDYLHGAAMTFSNLGASSGESSDYPDFVEARGRSCPPPTVASLASGCSTGISMSMAADKIPRASAPHLVFDEQMAVLARQHNNANVPWINLTDFYPDRARKIVEAFLATPFEGGRARPATTALVKWNQNPPLSLTALNPFDPMWPMPSLLERQRQQENVKLIASENFVSPAVVELARLRADQS